MTTISTHVLDTAAGKPAAGIEVRLERNGQIIASGVTDADGRLKDLAGDGAVASSGDHALRFSVGDYLGQDAFYGEIVIAFRVMADVDHYHVPLLLSPFGYSTYRGS